jgi:hypothetical protein
MFLLDKIWPHTLNLS